MLAFALLTLALIGGCFAKHEIIVPLDGTFDQYFFYWINVSIGTPEVPFTVIVDTGSADLLIPQFGCDSCYGGNPELYYSVSNSTTGQTVKCSKHPELKCQVCAPQTDQCGYTMSYVGISEETQVYSDMFYFTNDDSVGVVFGATYNVTQGPAVYNDIDASPVAKLNRKKALLRSKILANRISQDEDYPEGVMGLGYKGLNVLGTNPVFDALVASGTVKNVISHCLQDVGGLLGLGVIGKWNSEPIQYAESLPNKTFYSYRMSDVLVNGQSIGIPADLYNSGECIVDSGTPLATLPPKAFSALRTAFLNNCSTSQLPGVCPGFVIANNETLFDQQCYNLTESQIALFPTISFVLIGEDGSDLTLDYPSSQYLRTLFYCSSGVGMALDQEDGFTIMGASLLQLYNTVYDRAKFRVGFAPLTSCS